MPSDQHHIGQTGNNNKSGAHQQDHYLSVSFLCDVCFVIAHTSITKIRLYNIDPLKPHFYIVKLGFTGVYMYINFVISAQKHRL